MITYVQLQHFEFQIIIFRSYRRRPPSVCTWLDQVWSLYLLLWLWGSIFGNGSFCHRSCRCWSYHLVCRAGLPGDSLLLYAVDEVLLSLHGAALHNGSPGVPKTRETFPWLPVNFSTFHVSFARVFEAQSGRSGSFRELPIQQILGVRPSSILWTWLSQRRRCWLSKVKMVGSPACSSKSVLGILSCHLIPSMRRR
jgi:hypothetical protein